jgi:hypothetical protein
MTMTPEEIAAIEREHRQRQLAHPWQTWLDQMPTQSTRAQWISFAAFWIVIFLIAPWACGLDK